MKKFQLEIKWAILFSLLTLLWTIGEKISGLHDIHLDKQVFYTNFFAIPAILIYVFALLDKRKNEFQNMMNFQQGFVTGVYMSFIIMILSPIVQYISMTFISPKYFENIILFVVKNKSMTAIEAQKYFNLKSYIFQCAFFALSVGVVTSAIVAYFLQSKSKN